MPNERRLPGLGPGFVISLAPVKTAQKFPGSEKYIMGSGALSRMEKKYGFLK